MILINCAACAAPLAHTAPRCVRCHTRATNNYAAALISLQRFKEVKELLHKALPVAQRVLGENHNLMFKMKTLYARALYRADGATLDDLREAVTTLEKALKTAQRVLGREHPDTLNIRGELAMQEGKLRLEGHK